MDLQEEIYDVLEALQATRDRRAKIGMCNWLRDRIEYNPLEVGYLEGVVDNLIDLTILESDVEVRNGVFDVIEKAMMVNLSIAPSIDPLIPYLHDDDPAFICRVLLLAPLTGERKYRGLAEGYLNHPHAFVRKNAAYALKYLGGGGDSTPAPDGGGDTAPLGGGDPAAGEGSAGGEHEKGGLGG